MGLQLPRMVGGARILERLGEGGMAIVHRAEDPFRPDRLLAVKLLKPESAQDGESVRRFLREGDVLKRLRHPNLVEVYDFGRTGGTPYILMELLPGGSIRDCLGEAPARIVRRILPVLEALGVAHGEGVVHRDLKPSNLLFSAEGQLKVTDFGVCFWEGAEGATRLTRSQMVVGTLGYMAPEQHGDPRRVDARCDIYAIGSLLYEFTTGQPYCQVQLPPAAVRPGFPPGLAAILMQALAPDPAKRIASMEALSLNLSRWLESAAAAGWGEEPLPGYSPEEQEQATVARLKDPEAGDPDRRLGPYLDALRTGGVGSRRAAAEGLLQSAKPEDEPYLLTHLAAAPDGARFALATALGAMGSQTSIPALQELLSDPFARAEAAEALSRIAQRCNLEQMVLESLHTEGLGSSWLWAPRCRLGDSTWVESLLAAWANLSLPVRLQALEAASLLPDALRARIRSAIPPPPPTGTLGKTWLSL